MVTPIFYGELFLMLLLAIVAFYAGNKIGEGAGKEKGIEIGKKIYFGKLIRKNDLLINERYKVLGIAPSDSGNEKPRFAMAVLEGRKNQEDVASQWFGVDLAFKEVSDDAENLRIKASDTIAVKSDGNIAVVR